MVQSKWRSPTVLGAALLGAPACCVCGSTLVRTPRGPRPLGELRVGDLVLSYAVDSGELVTARVVAVRTARRECLSLGFPGGELVCTPDHPLYSPESGGYEPASRWVDGARRTVLVVAEQPTVAQVVRVDRFVGMRQVVDITVDAPMHNFVAAGIVVHNKSFITTISEHVDGPSFVLEPGDPAREFEIRACVEGRDPSAERYGSSLEITISTEDAPSSLMGDMSFAVYVPDGLDDETRIDDVSGARRTLDVGSMAGLCTTPLPLVFDRVDGWTDGAISFTWEVWGETEPPQGTTLDDTLDLEIEG